MNHEAFFIAWRHEYLDCEGMKQLSYEEAEAREWEMPNYGSRPTRYDAPCRTAVQA
jgi:hypothetical protein